MESVALSARPTYLDPHVVTVKAAIDNRLEVLIICYIILNRIVVCRLYCCTTVMYFAIYTLHLDEVLTNCPYVYHSIHVSLVRMFACIFQHIGRGWDDMPLFTLDIQQGRARAKHTAWNCFKPALCGEEAE